MAVLARLTKKRDFDRAFSAGAALHRRSLKLLAAENGLDCLRLGMAVPKRLVPLATRRNRVRRMIRESVREAAAGLPPLDIVVLLKGRAENFEFEFNSLRSDLASLLAELSSPSARR